MGERHAGKARTGKVRSPADAAKTHSSSHGMHSSSPTAMHPSSPTTAVHAAEAAPAVHTTTAKAAPAVNHHRRHAREPVMREQALRRPHKQLGN